MRKLWFLVIAALAMSVAASESASAKGNDFTIIVGGGNLAPYYYAIPGPLPIQGWNGLLEIARDNGVSASTGNGVFASYGGKTAPKVSK